MADLNRPDLQIHCHVCGNDTFDEDDRCTDCSSYLWHRYTQNLQALYTFFREQGIEIDVEKLLRYPETFTRAWERYLESSA